MSCIFCGVDKDVATDGKCYADLASALLVIPCSPDDLLRQHLWIPVERDVRDGYFGGGEI